MADADDSSKAAMEALVANAPRAGLNAYCTTEQTHATDQSPRSSSWRSLEVEVSARVPVRGGTAARQSLAADVTSYAFAIPLCLVQIEEIGPVPVPTGEAEGALSHALVNKYERSPANRAACLAYHGTRCRTCGFDFGAVYGDIGTGFIEVHHTVPVSSMGDSYVVDPVNELVPLCSNCHSMVHRVSPPMDIDELRMSISAAVRLREATPHVDSRALLDKDD